MWRRFSAFSTVLPLIGFTVLANTVRAADTPSTAQLLERIRVLEERLNKAPVTPDVQQLLERIRVLEERVDKEGRGEGKKTVEYVCPSGKILEQLPSSGRCPDGRKPQVREKIAAVRPTDTPAVRPTDTPAVRPTDTPEAQRLHAVEERLDRLDRVEVFKKTVEYVCPSGEILEQLPSSGRCPDGEKPQVRDTIRTSTVSRRESIAEKIEGALQDAESKKVTVGGSARGTLQQVLNAPEHGDNKLFGQGAVDLTLLYRPMVRTTLFVDLEAIGGPGPDHVLGSLSRLNADAETLGDQDEKLTVREAWLGLRLINDHLDIFLGKLDPTNYFDRNAFANDETSQFLNTALVNNPMLKQPVNGPGLVARWDAGRDLGFSLGGITSNDLDEDLLSRPYVVGEIDYHSARFIGGNYRLWARVSTLADEHDRLTWGVGVSLDQLLTPQLGVFARAGFSQSEEESRIAYAVSTGFQVTSPLGERPRDRLGMGYSFQHEAAGDEHLIEAYYNLFLTDHFAVIGNVEWLIYGPNQVTGKTNRHVVVPGIRGVVGF